MNFEYGLRPLIRLKLFDHLPRIALKKYLVVINDSRAIFLLH